MTKGNIQKLLWRTDMKNGKIVAICVAPKAGDPMRRVQEANAFTGCGLEGDRYTTGGGSFNKVTGVGNRQVTLMNALFFPASGFLYEESRRNLFVSGEDFELMWLIGKDFTVGDAWLRGVKYCDPCDRHTKLTGDTKSFKMAFLDRGGLIAEVTKGGFIRVGDEVVPPPKGY